MSNHESTVNPERREPSSQFEVAFLPWLGRQAEITVGPVTFSPFELRSVAEPAAREYLSRYFSRYMEVNGSPLEVIVLARHAGVAGFRYHTDMERLALRRAAAALALATITEAWMLRIVHNNMVPVPSADSFQLFFQRFTARSNFVTVTAGHWEHTWPLDQVMFTRPWASSAVDGQPDRHVLEALGMLLLSPGGIPADLVERVWRSIEWFRLAHLDGADQTDEMKLVAMATAFESLLNLPMLGKQAEFARAVEALVRDPEMGRDVRVRRDGNQLALSLAGCWAWDFYEIRSRLVHGDAVSPADFNDTSRIPHLVVADLVFRECILRQLFEFGCFGADLRESAATLDRALAGIPEGPEPFDALAWTINYHLQFFGIHRLLGWSRAQTPSEVIPDNE